MDISFCWHGTLMPVFRKWWINPHLESLQRGKGEPKGKLTAGNNKNRTFFFFGTDILVWKCEVKRCLFQWESNWRNSVPAKKPSHPPRSGATGFAAGGGELSTVMLSPPAQLCCLPLPALQRGFFFFFFSSYYLHLPGAHLPGGLLFYTSMLIAIKVPSGSSLPASVTSPSGPSSLPLRCSGLSPSSLKPQH